MDLVKLTYSKPADFYDKANALDNLLLHLVSQSQNP